MAEGRRHFLGIPEDSHLPSAGVLRRRSYSRRVWNSSCGSHPFEAVPLQFTRWRDQTNRNPSPRGIVARLPPQRRSGRAARDQGQMLFRPLQAGQYRLARCPFRGKKVQLVSRQLDYSSNRVLRPKRRRAFPLRRRELRRPKYGSNKPHRGSRAERVYLETLRHVSRLSAKAALRGGHLLER